MEQQLSFFSTILTPFQQTGRWRGKWRFSLRFKRIVGGWRRRIKQHYHGTVNTAPDLAQRGARPPPQDSSWRVRHGVLVVNFTGVNNIRVLSLEFSGAASDRIVLAEPLPKTFFKPIGEEAVKGEIEIHVIAPENAEPGDYMMLVVVKAEAMGKPDTHERICDLQHNTRGAADKPRARIHDADLRGRCRRRDLIYLPERLDAFFEEDK